MIRLKMLWPILGVASVLLAGPFSLARAAADLSPDEAREIAEEAYVYGFPMVMGYKAMQEPLVLKVPELDPERYYSFQLIDHYTHNYAYVGTFFGPDDIEVATDIGNISELYRVQGRFDEAEPLFERTLTIQKNFLGPDNRDIVPTLEGYASLLRAADRTVEATKFEARAAFIRAKQAE